MNRRAFLKTLLTAAAGVGLDQAVPEVARCYFLPPAGGWQPQPAPLAFHPDALALTIEDFRRDYLEPAARELARKADEGLAIRFVRQYDVDQANKYIARLDVLYGFAAINPRAVCRITSA